MSQKAPNEPRKMLQMLFTNGKCTLPKGKFYHFQSELIDILYR